MRRITAGALALLLLLFVPSFAYAETTPTRQAAAATATPQPAAVTVTAQPTAVTRNPQPAASTPERDTPWLLYIVLGVVIVGADTALIILIRNTRKKTKEASPVPHIASAEPPRAERVLVGVSGPLEDSSFSLKAGETVFIGRDESRCQVLFAQGTPGVSSIHCKISFDGEAAAITDLGSSYGTFVDGKKLEPNKTITLHRGLAVDIGSENNRFALQ